MIRPNIAILGATGAVGQEFIKLIEERNFPFKHGNFTHNLEKAMKHIGGENGRNEIIN